MEESGRGFLPLAVDVNPGHFFMSQTQVVPYELMFCNLFLIDGEEEEI